MNLIRSFMNMNPKQDLFTIPSGSFYLLRSMDSPKSSLECIYNDAMIQVRETGKFLYEVVVCKVDDEAELADGDGSDDLADDAISVLSTQSKKRDVTWAFPLSEKLNFHKKWSDEGNLVFIWNNVGGDEEGEKVQFVISSNISLKDVEGFLDTIYKCEYATKFKKSPPRLNSDDLVILDDLSTGNSKSQQEAGKQLLEKLSNMKLEEEQSDDSDSDAFEDAKEDVSSTKVPGTQKYSTKVSLLVFDPIQATFILQSDDITVTLSETGPYEYWLGVQNENINLGTDVSPNINPTFEFPGFIFNYVFNNITLSYMLRFPDKASYKVFQDKWSQIYWMALNKEPWNTMSEREKDYVVNSSTLEAELDEILGTENPGREGESDDDDEEEEEEDHEYSRLVISTESFDEKKSPLSSSRPKSEGNSSLAVAFKNNRSYVIRDDKIGVFRSDEDDDGLEFVGAIKGISSLSGHSMTPESPMLYMEDRSMVLADKSDPSILYKMDLERGKIIEEWSTGDKGVVQFGPTKKFDQLTAEQTILGVSQKGIFKIDPRLNTKNKIVQEQSKEYKTKYNFSSLGTTESGYIAVGSAKGDVKLYDKLGIRAKTAIPSLGQPIKHISVSANGKWLLATCESSLLLMDLTVKTGKNSGNSAFLKPFPANENAKTYILRIRPEHVSYMLSYAKKPINFSKAYFNAGIGAEEQTIVTSTGPFAVTWSLPKVLAGNAKPYKIKRYNSDVIEDNFEFGTNEKVIVALKNDVSLSKVKSFKQPNKTVLYPKASIREFYDDFEALNK